ERVLGRHGEHNLIAEERLENDAAMTPRRTDDAQLELALRDPLDHGLRVGDREGDGDTGVRALELAEENRNDRANRPRGRADVGRAAELAAVGRLQLVDELLLELEHPLSAAVESRAGLGRLDAAPGAVEQLAAEALLERADLQADGRLGDAEPLRRMREALALDNRAERRELARVHKQSLSADEAQGDPRRGATC